jgi:hypothetical protein
VLIAAGAFESRPVETRFVVGGSKQQYAELRQFSGRDRRAPVSVPTRTMNERRRTPTEADT